MTYVRRITPNFEKDHLSGQWKFASTVIGIDAEFTFSRRIGGLEVSTKYFRGFKPGKYYRIRYGNVAIGTTSYADVRLYDLARNANLLGGIWLHSYDVSTSRAQLPLSQFTFLATGLERLTLRIVSTNGLLSMNTGLSHIEVQEIR